MLQRLARTCYRRRRMVLLGWIGLLVAFLVLRGTVGGEYHTNFELPGSESQEAFDLLEERGFNERTGEQALLVFNADQGVDDPEVQSAMEDFFAAIQREVAGTSIASPYAPGGERQIAEGGTTAYAELRFDQREFPEFEKYTPAAEEIKELRDEVQVDGLSVELGSDIFADFEFGGSEALGFLAAMIILLIAFGSLLAMGMPLLTALFGIMTGSALVILIANFVDMPVFTEQSVLMIAIGVGIDYALFIVTRYREGLHDGMTPEHAVVRAIDTAGRAVLFAGTTVIIAVLGLFAMGLSMMNGLAIGVSLGVLMTMLASLTLLPAMLGFVGRNIDRLGLPHRRRSEGGQSHSFWYRWSRVVQRRPWPALVIAAVVLIALAIPLLSLRLGFGDAGNRKTTDTTRRAYDLISDGFGPGFNGPLLLAAETPGGSSDLATLEGLADQVRGDRGIQFASDPIPNEAGDAAIIQVFPTTSPQEQDTEDLIYRLRDNVIPQATAGTDVEVHVGGSTAAVLDFARYMGNRLPVFVGMVLVLSFLLLMVVFRSVLVPLKAVIMNLLSIGAAYGILVAVFQWGWGASLIGVGKEGPIEAWAPMMLFAVLFGLSMDYEVFLLSRIREDYDRTHDNAEAVANGLAATARVITAAAAIMFCVFAAFVLGNHRDLKLFGLGLATAVLIDATIVRLVLVPATMELLGDRNWWLPRWLDRILPTVHVEAMPEDLDAELAALAEEEAVQEPS